MLTAQTFQRWLKPVTNRIKSMIGKALVNAVNDSDQVQLLKITGMAGDVFSQVERIQEYGRSSHPPVDAEVIFAALGGNKDHIVALKTGYSIGRPNSLSEGDVVDWDVHGNKINRTEDGIKIEDKNGNVIEMVDGKISIQSNGNIELNGNSKSFVTYAELDLALQQMVAMINTHTHITTATVGPTPTPGVIAPPTVPIQLNIAASETQTIKTGG